MIQFPDISSALNLSSHLQYLSMGDHSLCWFFLPLSLGQLSRVMCGNERIETRRTGSHSPPAAQMEEKRLTPFETTIVQRRRHIFLHISLQEHHLPDSRHSRLNHGCFDGIPERQPDVLSASHREVLRFRDAVRLRRQKAPPPEPPAEKRVIYMYIYFLYIYIYTVYDIYIYTCIYIYKIHTHIYI